MKMRVKSFILLFAIFFHIFVKSRAMINRLFVTLTVKIRTDTRRLNAIFYVPVRPAQAEFCASELSICMANWTHSTHLRQECHNSKFGIFELLVWRKTFADALLTGIVS
jgi:hypothetical protein